MKLLSLIVPTLNRRVLLEETLGYLTEQLTDYFEDVELIVVDNASDDTTSAFLSEWEILNHGRVVRYSTRVEIDASFERCIAVASGRYINIFGDDDLPMVGYLQTVIKILKGQPVSLVYFNHLIGNENLSQIGEVAHPDRGPGTRTIAISEFIRTFTHHPGFITSLVFHRDCWINGGALSLENFSGYKFLARVYAGARGLSCVYVGLPSLIQRRGIQSWKAEWPRYWLVNMPRLLAALEMDKTTAGALQYWQKNEVNLRRLLTDVIVAKAFGYNWKDPFWLEACRFQLGFRKLVVLLVRMFLPCFVASALYFRLSKYRRIG